MSYYPTKRDRELYVVKKPSRKYHPKTIGMLSGVLEIKQIETKWSPYYERDYKTGWAIVKCLACDKTCEHCHGQPFRVRLSRLSLNATNNKYSKVSCGCCWRKRRPGKYKPKGRAVADLTDIVFGQLEPLSYEVGEGWSCQCTCGRLCVATPTQLLKGLRTACHVCKREEWTRRPGRPSGVKREPKLIYLRPRDSAPMPDRA